MKKLFMLSLAALVFAPVVYAQQPAQSSEPVSYTHLNVYKRQPLYLCKLCPLKRTIETSVS